MEIRVLRATLLLAEKLNERAIEWPASTPAAKLEPDPSRPRYLVTEAGLGYRLRNGE